MNEILIQRLSIKDAKQFQEIKLQGLRTDPEAFVATWEELQNQSSEQIKNRLQTEYILGAFSKQKLIGTLHLIQQEKQKFSHIGILGGMYIDPLYRGLGIGKMLLVEMLTYIKSLNKYYSLQLKVITSNSTAIKLYESFGFIRWATEENALHYNGNYWGQYHYMLILKPNTATRQPRGLPTHTSTSKQILTPA